MTEGALVRVDLDGHIVISPLIDDLLLLAGDHHAWRLAVDQVALQQDKASQSGVQGFFRDERTHLGNVVEYVPLALIVFIVEGMLTGKCLSMSRSARESPRLTTAGLLFGMSCLDSLEMILDRIPMLLLSLPEDGWEFC